MSQPEQFEALILGSGQGGKLLGWQYGAIGATDWAFSGAENTRGGLNDGGTGELAADQVFLNVGTHAAIPNVPGLEAARPLTHIEALELDCLPPHLIVFGGGYVGLELAQTYRRFGSRVTIIQSGPQLMVREDPDVADEMQRILSEEGNQILVAAETLNVEGRSGEEVSVIVRTTSGKQKIGGSDILVATKAHSEHRRDRAREDRRRVG
jgi:pyruvate/2-oxoglutarate dehydrogenase complex dihydrolipoamide dehydrogenase (E3) component